MSDFETRLLRINEDYIPLSSVHHVQAELQSNHKWGNVFPRLKKGTHRDYEMVSKYHSFEVNNDNYKSYGHFGLCLPSNDRMLVKTYYQIEINGFKEVGEKSFPMTITYYVFVPDWDCDLIDGLRLYCRHILDSTQGWEVLHHGDESYVVNKVSEVDKKRIGPEVSEDL